MTVLTPHDATILTDYLKAYKECFEAMNDLLVKICDRVPLRPDEIELVKESEAKYKNMVYHIRKWDPIFKKINQS